VCVCVGGGAYAHDSVGAAGGDPTAVRVHVDGVQGLRPGRGRAACRTQAQRLLRGRRVCDPPKMVQHHRLWVVHVGIQDWLGFRARANFASAAAAAGAGAGAGAAGAGAVVAAAAAVGSSAATVFGGWWGMPCRRASSAGRRCRICTASSARATSVSPNAYGANVAGAPFSPQPLMLRVGTCVPVCVCVCVGDTAPLSQVCRQVRRVRHGSAGAGPAAAPSPGTRLRQRSQRQRRAAPSTSTVTWVCVARTDSAPLTRAAPAT
jgi:hypothetical protein